VVAAVLTYMMYQRYSSTGKFMPAGMVASLSGVMTGELLRDSWVVIEGESAGGHKHKGSSIYVVAS
jgi:hypothetical protein